MTESPEQRPWTWSEVASWIDTEGTMSSGIKKTDGKAYCNFSVAQKERKVLDSLCDFIREVTGKHCSVYYAKKAKAYYAQWSSKEAVEITLKQIEPYLRTQRKKDQCAKVRLMLPLIITEKEQRILAAAKGREAQRKKRLLNTS